jgi:beta-galactosidase GanA
MLISALAVALGYGVQVPVAPAIPALVGRIGVGFGHAASGDVPHLGREGEATQLIVKGKPFLMLGGELNNSSSSSLSHMTPIWKRMADSHLNTLLVPLAWDLVEPKEGRFDFALLDGLIRDARKNRLHIVFLWLSSWKNGMSSYIPLWVKEDYKRFPRVRRKDGSPTEILSTLSEESWKADGKAFAAVMRHIRQIDAKEQTVLMMQVENEVGVLGDSRDRSPAADEAYAGQVPKPLLDRLQTGVVPELRDRWMAAGGKSSGTWEEVFGPGVGTEEMFMAWNYARYVDHVAAAGKAEYPIPMYANAWLNEGNAKPGDYPSGCPESHVLDIWKAGAPNLDMLSPDLYAANFTERCRLFTRQGNPLFIPEMNSSEDGARNVFYAIGVHHAIGTSPFGIDRTTPDSPIAKSYAVLSQVAPAILENQGLGRVVGFTLDKDHPKIDKDMGGYRLEISLDSVFGRTASLGYGIVIATGNGEYLGAGSGFRVMFKPITPGPSRAGIGSVEEGTFKNGTWVPGRRLNGDETDQGWSWRFSSFGQGISKCVVYRYE